MRSPLRYKCSDFFMTSASEVVYTYPDAFAREELVVAMPVRN